MPMLSGLKNLLKSHHISPSSSTPNSPPSASSSSSSAAPPQDSASASQSRRSRDAPSSSTTTSTSSAATAVPSTSQQQQQQQHQQQQMSSSKVEQAESIVRKENEAKAKRDQQSFEGLPEGVQLGIKMGDGAFSNVYQATLRPNAAQLAIDPSLGKSVKVAVKCVRKYELNHSQVSPPSRFCRSSSSASQSAPARRGQHLVAFASRQPNLGRHRSRPSKLQLSRSCCRAITHLHQPTASSQEKSVHTNVSNPSFPSSLLSLPFRRRVIVSNSRCLSSAPHPTSSIAFRANPRSIRFVALRVGPGRKACWRGGQEEAEGDRGSFTPWAVEPQSATSVVDPDSLLCLRIALARPPSPSFPL